MPNWCYTNYVIEGPKENLDEINHALENPACGEDNTNSDWVGYFLKALNIDTEKYSRMRGFIHYYYYENDIIHIESEDAWYKTDMDEALIDKYPELKIYYSLEEPGMGIYETNDAEGNYFPDRFYVDTCINGNYEADYFETEEEAFKWIEELSGCKNYPDVEKFNNEKENSDDFISIFEFDVYNE